MAQLNYRTINIDVLDPESSANFPMDTLLPGTLPEPTTSGGAASVAQQVRQMLRGGDPEGALRHVLDTAPLSGDAQAKEVHLATVIEVLQGIRQGEMLKVLEGVIAGEDGTDRADCLMKYMYVSTHCGFSFCFVLIYKLTVKTATRVWQCSRRLAVPNRLLRARLSPLRVPARALHRCNHETLEKAAVVNK
jgi:hypothetical protein